MQDSGRLLAFSRLDTDAQRKLDQSIGAGADVDEVERRLYRQGGLIRDAIEQAAESNVTDRAQLAEQ